MIRNDKNNIVLRVFLKYKYHIAWNVGAIQIETVIVIRSQNCKSCATWNINAV